MTTEFDIVGIGVSVWDNLFLVDELPHRGQVVQACERVEGIGGGITVALATAAQLGSRVALVDSLGDDPPAKRILETLQTLGVDCRQITQHLGKTSSVASIWADKADVERTIVFSPGSACDQLSWSNELGDAVASAKLLHLNGRHPEVCRRAIEIAKQATTLVSFDGGAYRYRPQILPMLMGADIAIVAAQFAAQHFQMRYPNRSVIGARELVEFLSADLGCQIAGVTDGAGGSYLKQQGQPTIFQPAIEVDQAVDTTGCGDTYHGAFLHAWVAEQSLSQAAQLAAQTASQNARRMGAYSLASMPGGQ
ncbi:carbohydrate kinase family protein [Stieleria sp. TO1_6]|uniref:carbohydrate kinase family protein n=1 Tax=Stieleria tagensis TaxID=2956795 RepID=UPI00209B8A42|nr:carbohydrate kinase family protein [Stieleria tagensis]MCO8120595.1 carbohydrate kinase family protein [Stieleria tagensis]